MPRKYRIDAPGALHHIIARGIERGKIFADVTDKYNFLERLGDILTDTETRCYAWALIPNHFHLLLRTGNTPVATVMRRLLTGHALWFNRRHQRHGHLFQNRYKSILCQEDKYFLELVRYIHLNPIRAKLVPNMQSLDRYSYGGHSVLMGRRNNVWQDTDSVLRLFDEKRRAARRRYRVFVEKGVALGKRADLIGGGLIRSNGGWANVKAMRKAKVYQKADERILGDGEFVQGVLETAKEKMERKYALRAQGIDLDFIAERVSKIFKIPPEELWLPGKQRIRVNARSLLCYWACRQLGISMAEMSRKMNISVMAISYNVQRGEKLDKEFGYSLI
jgi:REP element-mobilizing transposase RayT